MPVSPCNRKITCPLIARRFSTRSIQVGDCGCVLNAEGAVCGQPWLSTSALRGAAAAVLDRHESHPRGILAFSPSAPAEITGKRCPSVPAVVERGGLLRGRSSRVPPLTPPEQPPDQTTAPDPTPGKSR